MMRIVISMAAAAAFFLLHDPAVARLDHGVGATSAYELDAQPLRRGLRRHHRVKPIKIKRQAAAPSPFAVVPVTCAGVKVRGGVSRSMAPRFEAFCRELAATGYKIKFVGGWRTGTCSTGSRHPCGGAIDINQHARNVCEGGCPRGAAINAMARRHGLLHGGEWNHADAGHFERLDRYSLALIEGPVVPVIERPHPLLGVAFNTILERAEEVAVAAVATAVEFAAEPVRNPVVEARTYLVRTATVGTTMRRQTPETSIGLLHPRFVVRLAPAIREARAAGLTAAGCFSAYRMPVWNIGGYRNKFDSNHAYGLYCDMAGVGSPGSREHVVWHKIATRHGLYNPYYGTAAYWEWNHYGVTPTVTAVRAVPALRRTITARGPRDAAEMWRVADVLVDKKIGGGPRIASRGKSRRVRWAAAS